MTTAVQDHLSLDLAEVKSWLGEVESDYDTHLQLYLDVAKEAADAYLQRPFTEAGGDDPIPTRVKLDVLEYVYTQYAELVLAREPAQLDIQQAPDRANKEGTLFKSQAIRSVERDGETVSLFRPDQSHGRTEAPKTLEQIQTEYWAPYAYASGF